MSTPISIKRSNYFGTYHIHVWHGCDSNGWYGNEVIVDKITQGRWFKKVTKIYSKEFDSVGQAIAHAENLSAEFYTNPIFKE